MNHKVRYILLSVTTSLLLAGCGGGSSSTSTVDIHQSAIENISTYADGETQTPPTLQDYENAGIQGVTEENLDEVNQIILQLNGEDVDTQEEIQAIVDSINSHTNQPPIADAGKDLSVQLGQSITITGKGEDPDGEITHFEWREDDTLLSTNASFIYYASSLGTHKLTLTVTDNEGATSSDTMELTVTEDNTLHITEPYQAISLGSAEQIDFSISVDTAPKNLYIVFSNTSLSSRTSASISHNNKVSENTDQKTISKLLTDRPKIKKELPKIRAFNQKLLQTQDNETTLISNSQKTIIVKNNASEGESRTFYIDLSEDGDSTNATLKKVVSDIDTEFGKKTLNIWVSDDSFDDGNGCEKSKCVTQDMVDALADTFLKSGTSNDIYDWVTNVYGEEWGAEAQNKSSNLIGETDEVNILLTDIENDDSTNGGVIGYFYSKDNYDSDTIGGSNEMIMFYIDSVLFANGDDTWDLEDFWPKEIVSTLAHEFQHMIHFYQKTVLRTGVATDTWLNEMLSETIEEVISTKIKHYGPRGVDYTDGSAGPAGNPYGRYPDFNAYNTLSLTHWYGLLADYSKVNAFGAYLTRTYGVGVLHDILQNNYVDENAVVYAVNRTPNGEGKTFNDLLQEWGVAVMLSSIENPEDLPTYNAGDFIESSFGDTTYDLGSINFFNYDPQPTIYTTGGTIEPQGNYYYLIGTGVSGKIDVNITLNGTTEATLIAK